MGMFDRIAENKIKDALEAGKFQNLPGSGKPIHWQENPYEPEGWGIAFSILKSNGFTLPWMEEGQEIDRDLASARQQFQQAYQRSASSDDLNTALSDFTHQIVGLNRRILGYNLRVPSPVFQKRSLRIESEIQALVK